jgi:hypothetical protein
VIKFFFFFWLWRRKEQESTIKQNENKRNKKKQSLILNWFFQFFSLRCTNERQNPKQKKKLIHLREEEVERGATWGPTASACLPCCWSFVLGARARWKSCVVNSMFIRDISLVLISSGLCWRNPFWRVFDSMQRYILAAPLSVEGLSLRSSWRKPSLPSFNRVYPSVRSEFKEEEIQEKNFLFFYVTFSWRSKLVN